MSRPTPPPGAKGAPTLPPGSRLAFFLGALSILVPLSVDMYLPCFPDLQLAFDANMSAVETSLSSFFVGMLSGQLFWGPFADKHGRRRPVLLGLILYLVSCVACFCAPNLPCLVVARATQAFGGCAGMVVARAIVRDCFVGARAAQMYASLTLVQGLGPILGPTVGASVSALLGWRGIFAVLAVTAATLFFAALRYLPETLAHPRRDLTLLKVLRTYGALLVDRSFMAYAATGSIMGAGMFAYISGSPFVFMEMFGLNQTQYGTLFACNAVGLLLATQSNRWLVRRFAPAAVLRVVTLVGCLSAISLLYVSYTAPTLARTLPPLVLFLTSLGLVWPNVAACAFVHQGRRAGMAAATQGALHWSLACLASMGTSGLHDGTPRPMAWIIVAAALSGTAVFTFFRPAKGAARRPLGQCA